MKILIYILAVVYCLQYRVAFSQIPCSDNSLEKYEWGYFSDKRNQTNERAFIYNDCISYRTDQECSTLEGSAQQINEAQRLINLNIAKLEQTCPGLMPRPWDPLYAKTK